MPSSLNQRLDDDLYNAYNRFDDALGPTCQIMLKKML
jgi:hypothetical protein